MTGSSEQFAVSGKKRGKTRWLEASICLLLTGFLLTDAEAQQAEKVPRIGYLSGSPASSIKARTEAFRQGLRDLGYVEGKNIVIEWRSGEGKRVVSPGSRRT
jgi:hypothetical protein